MRFYLLAQTTDAGSNNNTMAIELESILANADEPVIWEAEANNVWCYDHKLGLVVKEGLKTLGIKTMKLKPKNPNNLSMPIPIIQIKTVDNNDVNKR